ncbi:NADPH:quinone reductase-like Zn-dependent oxidoreductase [Kushneria sinocarnis]|uniref:NADPH:quinone reductase-like Zn-dependent oxidoreductase n=1 Tax=Kushneria sinocarnis TaxID=595502 RepID=A0A420WT93_9GAMM|nr:NAD(P)-dependent alcohol dehydrogenase [Kushneria sinocarnis]RKQ95731.1 NADPH:quinone reductase-like Zn-dependent oxidoreductase [Kushneria sinocarnis]
MKAAILHQPGGLDRIEVVELDPPQPGPDEVLVRMHASSLNYHDYAVADAIIETEDRRVLMSDGAGEVVAAGHDISEFQVGDRVISTFFPHWADGPITPAKREGTPGDRGPGMAAEYVVGPAGAFTRAPAGYSHAQAATLPCAALTAWRALMVEAAIKPGDTVLTMGTGGVSLFALQLARAAGARVIATSGSEEKLARLRALGADDTINYREDPDWGETAHRLSGGGVDAVVEIGGPATLGQSIAACRMGGHIVMLGVLTGFTGEVPTAAFFFGNLHMSGITVGSRAQQQDMVKAIEQNGIEPVIDSTWSLDRLADAFRHQQGQRHFGKICIDISRQSG